MSRKPPRGMRMNIALVGRRNAGKSSLINAMAGQDIAIVSDTPGTTTDPVAKPYELLPLGPVTFFDTPGLDDHGELGELRVKAARKVLWKTDAAVVVIGDGGLDHWELDMMRELKDLGIPMVAAFNKADLSAPKEEDLDRARSMGATALAVSAVRDDGIDALKTAVIGIAPPELVREPVLAGDLISPGDKILCVTPIDLAAPKGRLILPQVQVLREILDCDAVGLVVKERELEEALAGLARPPDLCITDSQAVLKVAGDLPSEVPLTTFSILFARFKGDLPALARGAAAIDALADGDTVLIAEACSHHPVADDIGRVKIPRWMTRYTGRDLNFEVAAGHDFPEDLERFSLVVHCGACMLNRAEMIRRTRECARRGPAMTNYGVAISKCLGVLDRVLAPFDLS